MSLAKYEKLAERIGYEGLTNPIDCDQAQDDILTLCEALRMMASDFKTLQPTYTIDIPLYLRKARKKLGLRTTVEK